MDSYRKKNSMKKTMSIKNEQQLLKKKKFLKQVLKEK